MIMRLIRQIKLTFVAVCTLALFSVSAQADVGWFHPHVTPHNYDNHPYAYKYPHPHAQLWATPWFKSKGSEVYRSPMLGGKRLDFCYKDGRYCGRTAANAFCRMHGYRYATRFHVDKDVGVTRTIGNNHVRKHVSRDGFRWLKCRG